MRSWQLLDRERIQVLHRQLAEQIVLATRQILIGIHHCCSVDPGRTDVNKTQGSYGARNTP